MFEEMEVIEMYENTFERGGYTLQLTSTVKHYHGREGKELEDISGYFLGVRLLLLDIKDPSPLEILAIQHLPLELYHKRLELPEPFSGFEKTNHEQELEFIQKNPKYHLQNLQSLVENLTINP